MEELKETKSEFHSVKIDCEYNKTINFAMQQNHIAAIRNIHLTNLTDKPVENVLLRLTVNPEFAAKYTQNFSLLNPNEPVELSPVKLMLLPDYLLSLTEKVVGALHIELLKGEEIIGAYDDEIELLPYDQWPGIKVFPELISAFVTPNHPAVARVLNSAGKYLNEWISSPSFTGYQTQNPDTVKKQMGAIYAALQEEGIAYSVPPASFETTGQRIRLPHTVLEQKCGTCLDLALLYASCIEAVGLKPLIVFVKGHAFAGCYLCDENSADTIIDDETYILKRMASGIDAISVVECTDFTAGKGVSFDSAEKDAGIHLSKPEDYIMAVDVARSRAGGVRPIPVRIDENGKFVADYDAAEESMITSAPKDINHREFTALGKEMTKQMMWERKLLDLSLRNQLLNFRATKNTIQLITANIATVEDELVRGGEFKLVKKPSEFNAKIKDARLYELENDSALIETVAGNEFKNNRICTFLDDEAMETALKNIARQAKQSFEENGCNTLYLALGFLRWYETDLSEKARYAPLVLVPIDLVKKSASRAYTIRVRDEDTQMNITMLEMLRQNFGIDITGLDPLPSDENGVDIPQVFQIIRQAVMAKKNWEIEDMCFIGLFSFSQFIMWNDIRNRTEDLKTNKIVASLMEGKMMWEPEETGYTQENIDEQVSPMDTAIPTSADSSQLLAICEAGKGQSLVLHGPPGTGKSQTITNMIANALYNGKTVLFVAEKQAALNVVKNRLEKLGLGPFCLELHSNKAQKRAVLDQLDKTLDVGRIKKPEDYAAEAQRLLEVRKSLNDFVTELHRQRNFGMSLYDAIAMYEGFEGYKDRIKFTKEAVTDMVSDTHSKWQEAVRLLVAAGEEFGETKNSPFLRYQNSSYSMELRQKLTEDIDTYVSKADGLFNAYNDILEYLESDGAFSYEDYRGLAEILSFMQKVSVMLSPDVYKSLSEDKKKYTEAALNDGISASSQLNSILNAFDKAVLAIDVRARKAAFKENETKWFLAKSMGEKKYVKELAVLAKNPSAISVTNLENYYDVLIEYHDTIDRVKSQAGVLSQVFSEHWIGENTDYGVLKAAYDTAKMYSDMVSGIKINDNCKQNAAKKAASDKQGFKTAADTFISVFEDFMSMHNAFVANYKFVCEDLKGSGKWLSATKDALLGIKENVIKLKEWTVVLRQLEQLKAMGLSNVANSYYFGNVTNEDVYSCFEAGLLSAIITKTIDESPVLISFSGAQFEESIKRFEELDKESQELTIKELVARLSEKIPNTTGGIAGSSEVGILQKAIKSGGRSMSIRKLFDSIKTLLRRICPCMLMSPMSVAQYIDPSFPKFDLVIFDEASQLPTSEAVGAIARGENLIVVGDPKQLPPTSFFSTNIVDEENEDKEDLESVLDDCLAISMPQRHLLWHYRSRHESLIAYSNAKYYDNKLYTFPSPNDLESEVKWFQVDGCYDKGKTKQNRTEAEAIVAEITRRLKDEQLRKDSIGVVTFSVVQQNLIEDLLNDAFVKEPELETIAAQMHEPIFIKNLENVQGDERDVILFSICYGPDKDGNVSMNFGPLNRDGGWRRLNVAISRSRKEMQVYSTIRPEQLDLSRSSAAGIEGLKGFLEFAMRGKNTLPVKNGSVQAKAAGIEQVIAEKIREMGYDVKCNIGCSEYKIDIGVVNPDNPKEYLLGIMCDGSTYAGSSTARDRNILQPSVLKGLGWRLMRVWTLDYLDNKEKVLQAIKAEIEKALDDMRHPSSQNEVKENNDVKVSSKHTALNPYKEYTNMSGIVFEREYPSNVSSHKLYERYEQYEYTKWHDPEDFYNDDYMPKMEEIIYDILHTEAPISKTSLGKRVTDGFFIERITARVTKRLEFIYDELKLTRTESGNNIFFWDDGQDPEKYDKFRVPESDYSRREICDIAVEELKNAVKSVVAEQISLERTDLVREVGKLFGYSKLGNSMTENVNEAIDDALNEGIVVLKENGHIGISE